jgi:hypothetical protein
MSQTIQDNNQNWPPRSEAFPELITPVETPMYLHLHEFGHTPRSAARTLNYRRNHRQMTVGKMICRADGYPERWGCTYLHKSFNDKDE